MMSFKEAAKEERAKLKELTFKGKLQYFWDYYKIVLVIIAIVALLISIGVQMFQNSQIKTGLYAMIFNTSEVLEDDSPLMTEFPKYAGFEETGEILSLDTSVYVDTEMKDTMTMSSLTKVMAVLGTGDLDVMIMPQDVFEYYAQDGLFYDLSEIMSKEQQTKFEPYFYEFKGKEDSEKKVYGLTIEEGSNWKNVNLTKYSPVVFCVVANSNRVDTALRMAEYLLK